MLAKVNSAAVHGLEGLMVAVELDIANGLPRYTTVGLPDGAVKESKERVVSALRNSGFQFPYSRVTVNLAPAQFKKRGTQFDLSIALATLAASGQLPAGDWTRRYCVFGELALDGAVKPVPGALPMALAARRAGLAAAVVPQANAAEAAAVGLPAFGVSSLTEAAAFVSGASKLEAASLPSGERSIRPEGCGDLADVKGQNAAKRALEIAAAGGHHLLFVGPPGTGKSMLAQRLAGLLAPLSWDEALEVASIASICGELRDGGWVRGRPFRAPHHTVTPAALVGGGSPHCKPGEASLAHGGVLFLDEAPEFDREALEALRVPLETGECRVSRVNERVRFPARFQLVAAMNPCPCGYNGHPKRACGCTPNAVQRYRNRLSGALLDRIDLRVEVAALTFEEWEAKAPASRTTAQAAADVSAARERQLARAGVLNSAIAPHAIQKQARLEPSGRDLLESAATKLALSARNLDRILRVSRTIADLASSEAVLRAHVAEAVQLSGRSEGTCR